MQGREKTPRKKRTFFITVVEWVNRVGSYMAIIADFTASHCMEALMELYQRTSEGGWCVMSFPKGVADKALIACGRHCCICHEFCGTKMNLHHIKQVAGGGEDTFDNCIPLCFDCHSDVGSYNPNHPLGRKYSEAELKGHRDNWYAKKGNLISEPVGMPQEIAIAIPPMEVSLNKSPFGNDLVPLLLIGAWCESLNNDQLVAAQVCGDNLSTWKKSLKDILILENSPLSMKRNTWKLLNHTDAWEEFAPRITDNDLDVLEKIAVAVLTENNPKYELARNERWYSNMLGKNLSHSSALRKGIATSLAWIGSNHQKLIHCTASKAEVMPILCAREIFKNISPKNHTAANTLVY